MKKIILFLLVVVVAAPVGFGFWADARLNALLRDFNQAGMVDFVVIKKNRGWFTSQVIIEAELSGNLAEKMGKLSVGSGTKALKVILENTVYHGPFPFMSGGFSLSPVLALVDTKFIKAIDSDESLINIDYSVKTEFNLMGSSEVAIDIPEWAGTFDGGNTTVDWQNLSGVITMADNLSNIAIDITVPLFKITSDNANFTIESMKLKSDSHVGIAGLSLGNAALSIGKIEFNDSAKSALTIRNSSIKIDTVANGDNVNSEISFNIEKLNIAGVVYGPAIFSIAFRNLDAHAIARINEKVKAVQNQNIPKDQVGMMMGITLMSELSNLLKQGPEIEIVEISLDSEVGKLMGNALITVDVSKPELLSSPFLVKDAIFGELDFEVPEELLIAINIGIVSKELTSVNIQYSDEQLRALAKERVTKSMGGLLAANIFIKVGNMYKMSASFEKGITTVNGRVLPLPFGVAPRQ